MNLKDFLKPNIDKIILTAIIVFIINLCYYLINISGMLKDCSQESLCGSSKPGCLFVIILALLPAYFFSCWIISIYNKNKNKKPLELKPKIFLKPKNLENLPKLRRAKSKSRKKK